MKKLHYYYYIESGIKAPTEENKSFSMSFIASVKSIEDVLNPHTPIQTEPIIYGTTPNLFYEKVIEEKINYYFEITSYLSIKNALNLSGFTPIKQIIETIIYSLYKSDNIEDDIVASLSFLFSESQGDEFMNKIESYYAILKERIYRDLSSKDETIANETHLFLNRLADEYDYENIF